MKVKNVYFDDFVNVGGHCSLTIAMPYCSFKCGKELCQNSLLARAPILEVSNQWIKDSFEKSSIMDCICFQGLEPFDSWTEVKDFISFFRKSNESLIVIYTGYNKKELLEEQLTFLKEKKNIIVKYGRFIPNQKPHFDEVLQVELVSDNQYAEVIK